MNTTTQASGSSLQAPISTRVAGATLAAALTLAMLLGVNTLASVDHPASQMAQGHAAASAAKS